MPGVEIGGAMKNVIAIASGVVEGLGLGHNAMAALSSRAGWRAKSRTSRDAEGGRRETLAGLSGLGDLVLSPRAISVAIVTSDSSSVRGRSLSEILGGMRMVAEGVRTTGAALALGTRHGIELPIAAEMAAVLNGQRSPGEAVNLLMGRKQRAEADR